jgi:hypothetical protein
MIATFIKSLSPELVEERKLSTRSHAGEPKPSKPRQNRDGAGQIDVYTPIAFKLPRSHRMSKQRRGNKPLKLCNVVVQQSKPLHRWAAESG